MLAYVHAYSQIQWTLEACIQTGITNNLGVQRSQWQLESASSNLLRAKESLLPTVSADISETFRTGRSIDPFTNQFILQTIDATNVSLSASLTLFNGFQQQNNIRRSRSDYQAAQYDLKQQKQQIALDIANAYLQVVMAKEQLNLAQVQKASTEAQLERVRAQLRAGTVAENQVLDLEAQLANEDINIVAAQNQLRLAKLNLQQLMNLTYDEAFDVESIDAESIQNPYHDQPIESLVQAAMQNQYSLRSAEMRAESASLSREIAQGRRLPTLRLSGGLSSFYTSTAPDQIFRPDGTTTTIQVPIGFLQSNPNEVVLANQQIPNGRFIENQFWNQMDFNFSSFVALSLNIPIYTAGSIRNDIRQARVQERITQLQLQETRNQTRQNVEQAYTNLLTAEITYQARLKQVEALRRTFLFTERRFEVGASSFVDYNLAKLNLARAEADLIRAKYEYLFRIKVLDYLTQPAEF